MNKIFNENQCPLLYRVDIDKNRYWYNQIIESGENTFPVEYNNEFPLRARMKAIETMEGDPNDVFFKPHDFKIYLIDQTTGDELLIYDGKELTAEILDNLQQELELYENYGYEFYGGKSLDKDGISYRIIDNPYLILEYVT